MADKFTDEPPPKQKGRLSRGLRLPMLSGKSSAAILVGCFLLSGLLILPLARRFPPWVDFELVIGLWWFVWVVGLTAVLHSGRKVSDDHALHSPRSWLGQKGGSGPDPSPSGCSGWYGWGFWDFPVVEFEGCAAILGVLAALVVAGVGIWLLIEVLIPGLAFVAYFLIRGMLAHVANDKHGCKGDLSRALAWSMLWATLYTAPLALMVWLAHFIHKPVGV
jgi:hypothetical protein